MCLDSDGTVYQTLVSDPTIAALWPWSAGPYPTSLQFRMAFYQAFRGFSAPDPADKTISAWTIHDAGATDVTGLSQADYLARVNQVYAGMALVGYLAPDLTTVVNQAPPLLVRQRQRRQDRRQRRRRRRQRRAARRR